MNYLTLAINYVTIDPYFWWSMSATSIMGLFIGSILYNGDLKQIKKALITIGMYATLIIFANLSRIVPKLYIDNILHKEQPLASSVTLGFITLFYVIGMIIGVVVTKLARKSKKEYI